MSDRNRSIELMSAAVDGEISGKGHPLRAIIAADPRRNKKNSASYVYALRKLLASTVSSVLVRHRAGEATVELLQEIRFDTDLLLDVLDADRLAISAALEGSLTPGERLIIADPTWGGAPPLDKTPYYRALLYLRDQASVQAFLWLRIMFPDDANSLYIHLLAVNDLQAFLFIPNPSKYEPMIRRAVEARASQAMQDGSVSLLYQVANRFSSQNFQWQIKRMLGDMATAAGLAPRDVARTAEEADRDGTVESVYRAFEPIYREYERRGALSRQEVLDLLEDLEAVNFEGRGDYVLEDIQCGIFCRRTRLSTLIHLGGIHLLFRVIKDRNGRVVY